MVKHPAKPRLCLASFSININIYDNIISRQQTNARLRKQSYQEKIS